MDRSGGVVIANTSNTVTMSGNKTINAPLTINTGANFIIGANYTLTVSGLTSVTGTFTDNSTGAKSFTGDVILNNGGVWNENVASTYGFAGNFTNNSTTFSAVSNSSVHTFSGTSKIISGSTTTSIATLQLPEPLTNSGTLTVGTALTGTGTLTNGNGSTGTLNIGRDLCNYRSHCHCHRKHRKLYGCITNGSQ